MAEVVAEYDDGSSTESETYEFEDAFAFGDATDEHLHLSAPPIETSAEPQPLAPSPAPPVTNCINILDLQASVLGDVATPQNETPAVHTPVDQVLSQAVRRDFPAIAERAVLGQLQVPMPAPLPVIPQYTAPRTRNAEKRDTGAVRATSTRPRQAKTPVVVDMTDEEVTDHYVIPRRKIPVLGQAVADHYTIPRRKIPPVVAAGSVSAPRGQTLGAAVVRATRKSARWDATPSAAHVPPLPTAAAGGVAASHGQARVAGGATPVADAIWRQESTCAYCTCCGHVLNEPTDIQAATTCGCICCLRAGLPPSMFSKTQRKTRTVATRKCIDCTHPMSGNNALKQTRVLEQRRKEREARSPRPSKKENPKPAARAAAVKARASWKAKASSKRVLEVSSRSAKDSTKRRKGATNSGRRADDLDEQQHRMKSREETWALTRKLVSRLGASAEARNRKVAEADRRNAAAKAGAVESRLERSRDLIAKTMNLPPPLPRSPPPSYYRDW